MPTIKIIRISIYTLKNNILLSTSLHPLIGSVLTLCGGIMMTGIFEKAKYVYFYMKIVKSAWETPTIKSKIMRIHCMKLVFYLGELVSPIVVLVIGILIIIV